MAIVSHSATQKTFAVNAPHAVPSGVAGFGYLFDRGGTQVTDVNASGPSLRTNARLRNAAENQFIPAASGDMATASGAAATVVYAAAGDYLRHQLHGISFGLETAPSGLAYVKVLDGSSTVFQIPVTAAGAGFFDFGESPKIGSPNTAMSVSLTNPGSGCVGYVAVTGRKIV